MELGTGRNLAGDTDVVAASSPIHTGPVGTLEVGTGVKSHDNVGGHLVGWNQTFGIGFVAHAEVPWRRNAVSKGVY